MSLNQFIMKIYSIMNLMILFCIINDIILYHKCYYFYIILIKLENSWFLEKQELYSFKEEGIFFLEERH